jgi:hypothetical protein
MSTLNTLSDIKVIKQNIEKLREEAKTKVESIFKTAALELFVEYPDLKSISWSQYTPYFNDGDSCNFSSNHSYAAIKFVASDDEDEDEDDDYQDGFNESLATPEQLKAGKAAEEFLENFDDDDMENLFGDHVKVIITKDGIEVEDYDHD